MYYIAYNPIDEIKLSTRKANLKASLIRGTPSINNKVGKIKMIINIHSFYF